MCLLTVHFILCVRFIIGVSAGVIIAVVIGIIVMIAIAVVMVVLYRRSLK